MKYNYCHYLAYTNNKIKVNNIAYMKIYFTHITTTILTIMVALCLTSCDEDVDTAYDLNGIWEGTIYGDYYYDRYGGAVATTSWDTQIEFVQNGDFSKGGDGTELDYNQDTGEVTLSEFTWTVRNGRIYMSYDDGYQIVINDYELYTVANTPRFRGYFLDWDTGEQLASFNLIKTSSWASWAKPKIATTLDD